MNLSSIPLEELRNDLAISVAEFKTCDRLILLGSDSLVSRLRTNKKIVETIENELTRRGIEFVPANLHSHAVPEVNDGSCSDHPTG
jgi:hypothetical protein